MKLASDIIISRRFVSCKQKAADLFHDRRLTAKGFQNQLQLRLRKDTKTNFAITTATQSPFAFDMEQELQGGM